MASRLLVSRNSQPGNGGPSSRKALLFSQAHAHRHLCRCDYAFLETVYRAILLGEARDSSCQHIRRHTHTHHQPLVRWTHAVNHEAAACLDGQNQNPIRHTTPDNSFSISRSLRLHVPVSWEDADVVRLAPEHPVTFWRKMIDPRVDERTRTRLSLSREVERLQRQEREKEVTGSTVARFTRFNFHACNYKQTLTPLLPLSPKGRVRRRRQR